MAEKADQSLLSPYRVLDLSDDKGMLCGKIMGDLGADVIKIERPEGDPERMIGPFYQDIPDPDKSIYWMSLNANKRGITLDIEKSEGQEKLRKLVKTADFIIESFPPGYMDSLGLGYKDLSQINPRIIMTSITPYGQTGPYKDYKISDLVGMALSGMMYTIGDPDRPPLRISASQTYALASAEAAIGMLIAHYHREITGDGQYIDMSIHESMSTALMVIPTEWEFSKVVERRLGCARRMATPPHICQQYVWPCKDGYVSVTPMMGGMMGASTSKGLVELMDEEGMAPDFLKEIDWPKLDMREVTQERYDQIVAPIREFLLKHTSRELHQMAIKQGVMLYPLNNVKDIMEDAQLKARDSLKKVENPVLGRDMTYPGPFAKFSETSAYSLRRPPRIGEHNEEVFRELAGGEEPAKKPAAPDKSREKVFEGLRVIEFTWVVAGPWLGKYLAEYGAEVIRIETGPRPDPFRYVSPYKDNEPGPNRAPMAAIFNNDKKGITLDLRNPKGIEIVKKLIAEADVMIENYTPGTMKKLGIGYEDLKKINPGLVMLSSSNQGMTGPYASQRGFGYQLSAFTGFQYLTGWPDRDPCLIRTPYTDIPGARFGLISLLAALEYKRRTGKGQYIDLSQYEAGLQFLIPVILDYDLNKRVANRDGNKSPIAAPHGAYPCQGDDRWCAISVFSEEEWERFCKVIGNPAWTKDSKFATFSGRKANEEELDKLIGEWTINHTAEQIMTMMQKEEVAAGAVNTVAELFTDPQLEHRKHFVQLEHPVIGYHHYFNHGFRLSKTPGKPENPGPCLGEHNEYVYTKVLGMSDEEFIGLMSEGLFQ